MTLGPIEMVVLELSEDGFAEQVRPQIVELVEKGIVRIVDALLVSKDDAGVLTILELEEIDDERLALGGELADHLDLISAEDAEELGEAMTPGASAFILVFEHAWMVPVRDSIAAVGGTLLADIYVPSDVVEEILAAVEQA